MYSRCCILIALPDDWWIGVSPPIQNKPLGTTKYKRGPYREKMHLRTGLEKLCTDAHVQMHISDGFFLISMQETHLFCCLEESQQTWRNTCVSSVLSPCEYDFHPYSIAVLCSHWDPFQSPSWTCLRQQTQSSTWGWRQSMKSAGCCTLGREWVDGLVTLVHWGCTGDARWALAWLGWEDELPGPAQECVCHLQMIWHLAHTELYLGHGIQEGSRLFPAPCRVLLTRVCRWFSHWALQADPTHAWGINFLCALLHCSLLQWQKAQLSSNHVFCKNEPREEKVGTELLIHVSLSDAIRSVSHVFLDISAYTENDTWVVQAIFRTDSFPFHSNNCFFNTLEYAKCFNKLLIGSRSNSETKGKL